MPERCPKCGSEKVVSTNRPMYGDEPLELRCPLDPKDCRIAELERQLEEVKAEVDSAVSGFASMKSERDEARSKLEEAKALRDCCPECPNCGAISEKGPFAPMDEDGCCLSCGADALVEGLAAHSKEVESERDAALAQVMGLRDALEHAVKQNDYDMLLTGDELREMAQALSNTSATAQRVKESIEREALEDAVGRVSAIWIDGGFNALGYVRAAILGEREP